MAKNKNYSFVAYIDESGKDDFNYSSDEWFVLSALIVRKSDRLNLVKERNEIIKKAGLKAKCLHMSKIRTEDTKRFIVKSVGNINGVTFISILANKFHFMDNGTNYKEKNMFYWELGKYLVERISQYCSKSSGRIQEGNGKVKIIFSKRGGMNYGDFQKYLFHIQKCDLAEKINNPSIFSSSIKWEAIDIGNVESINHIKDAGLQLVDVVAYSVFKSVQKNRYDMVNIELISLLKKNTFKNKNGYIGKGIKIIPNPDRLKDENKPLKLLEILKKT